MNENRTGSSELNLFTIASVPLWRWKLVAGVFAGIVTVAVVFAVTRRTVYQAEAVVLPAETEQKSPYLSDLAAGLPFGLGASLQRGGQEPRIVTILESRSVLDSIVRKLQLDEAWSASTPRKAAGRLKKATTILSSKDGPIRVTVEGEDPELVAKIANEYPRALNEINARLGAETARQRAQYLERQLAMSLGELEQAEEALVQFQRGMPAVEQQASMTITVAGQLQEQIVAKEARIAMLRRYVTAENPVLQSELEQLEVMRNQLDRLGRGSAERSEDIFLSFSEAPELGLTYKRLMREMTKEEQIYAGLTAGLAQARIEAGDDVPVVNVLDPAIVPAGPSGPNRRRIVMLAGLTGIVLGLFGAFAAEWGSRARRNPANREFFEAWRRFREEIRGRIRWRGSGERT